MNHMGNIQHPMPAETIQIDRWTGVKRFRFKPMDIAFADYLRKPRCLIMEVNRDYPDFCYTTFGETGGIGTYSDHSLRTLEEWLTWVNRFRDDLTGREIREVIEAAKAPFTEPDFWAEARERYAKTGDAFIKNV